MGGHSEGSLAVGKSAPRRTGKGTRRQRGRQRMSFEQYDYATSRRLIIDDAT